MALLGALAALAAPAAPEARAQPASTATAEAKAAAKAAADRGQALYDAGQYDQAILAFLDADQAFPAPTFKLMLARSYARVGRLREARIVYEQVADEPLPHYAPPVFFEAQAEAKEDLRALLPRIPTLTVQVRGAAGGGAQLLIDGQPAPIGEVLLQDPGEHTVTASAPGREPATQTVALQEGAAAQITLELKAPAPAAPPPASRPPAGAARAPVEEAPSGGGRGHAGPAIAAFGVAGAGVILGAVTGGLAAGKAATLEEECPDHRCYDGAGGEAYDSARTLSTVSTVGFVVGAAAAAAGITLLLWPREPRRSAPVGVVVGPGWTGVRGGF